MKPELAIEALCTFAGVTRRMDLIAEIGDVAIYDDFAHHPTAIRTTLQGLRRRVGSDEILAETRTLSEKGYGMCVGHPIEGMEVRIIGIDDEPIPKWSHRLEVADGEIGEIVLRSS